MKRLFLIAASLALSLAGAAGIAMAQEKGSEGIITDADGSYVTSTAGANPVANGEGGTIVYGDINAVPSTTVIGPPSVVYTAAPPPAAEPAPVVEAAPEPVQDTGTVAADETVATSTGTDLDGDNYPDDAEWNLGLDPNNIDTDYDGVADGDEVNIYGTEPTVYDTDGDGVNDGDELFGNLTNPLVWDDFSSASDAGTEAVAQQANEYVSPTKAELYTPTKAELYQKSNEVVRAVDGDAAVMGPGNASAAPGTVTRGAALLGPDGTYNVSDSAPSNVTISGDTEVIAPPADAAPTSYASCGNYASWYDAQIAYEAAGATGGDPALVQALDPDYDGIACEDGM